MLARQDSSGILLGILYAPTPFLGIVGSILCLWVPSNSGGKKPVLASLICQAVGNLLLGTCLVSLLVAHEGNLGPVFSFSQMSVGDRFALIGLGIGFAAWLIGDLAFFSFLRCMGRYVDQEEQADRANNLMMMWVLMIFVPPALLYGVKLLLEAVLEDIMTIGLFAVFMGVMLAWGRILFMVIRVILAIRKVIAKSIG